MLHKFGVKRTVTHRAKPAESGFGMQKVYSPWERFYSFALCLILIDSHIQWHVMDWHMDTNNMDFMSRGYHCKHGYVCVHGKSCWYLQPDTPQSFLIYLRAAQMALEPFVLHLWMKPTLLYPVFAGLKLPACACFDCFFRGQELNTFYDFQNLCGNFWWVNLFTRF